MRDADDELIRLDLELDLAAGGNEPQECDQCGGWTYDRACPCAPTRILDPAERLLAEKGEAVTLEDFQRLWESEATGADDDVPER